MQENEINKKPAPAVRRKQAPPLHVHIWRHYGNYIFFCTVFMLYELWLRLSSMRQFMFGDFFFAVVFNMILGFFICYGASFFSRKTRVITSNAVLSVFSALYISQIIYYSVFATFYNPESMLNAGQIAQFWLVILKSIWEKLIYILLCALPIPVYNIFVRTTTVVSIEKRLKRLTRMEAHWFRRRRYIRLSVIASVYLIMLVSFFPFAVSPQSSYSMFFGQQSYEDSIRRTGLLSTLQTDLIKIFVEEDASGALIVPDLPWVYDPEQFTWEDAVQNPENPEDPGNPGEEEPDRPGQQLPVIYGYNVMDIDFGELMANEDSTAVKSLHDYFAYMKPTRQNQYTGMFEGYNLIFLTAEGFSHFAVHEELTPTLYKLVHEGFHFTNFYTPIWGVSTSDGEYVACTGLIPKSGVWSFSRSSDNYLPFVMGNQLKNLGYKTVAYHNHTHTYYNRHKSHPNMGYTYKGVGNGMQLPRVVWPNSDLEMMQVTIDEYINEQPFHAYYMTVSGHLEYNFIGNHMASRNKAAVDDLPYSTACKAYIACNIELDKALEYLLERLNEAGIAERTVIVLSSDHYPYGLIKDGFDGISEFLGYEVDKNFELYENNLIIYAQGMEPVTIDKPCSSLDIIPTISNLMGLEFDSRLLMGQDILSNSDPLVIFADRSFITDKGRRIRNGDFIPDPGVTVEEDYSTIIRARIDAKFTASTRILDLDYYRKVFR